MLPIKRVERMLLLTLLAPEKGEIIAGNNYFEASKRSSIIILALTTDVGQL